MHNQACGFCILAIYKSVHLWKHRDQMSAPYIFVTEFADGDGNRPCVGHAGNYVADDGPSAF